MRTTSLALVASLAAISALSLVACLADQGSIAADGGPPTQDASAADAPIDATHEASSDAAHDGDDLDARRDGAPCAPGSSLYYNAPGCSVQPVCLGDVQDACAGTFCGCDGVTFFDGCGTAQKPFAHLGACDDAGDAGDAGGDH